MYQPSRVLGLLNKVFSRFRRGILEKTHDTSYSVILRDSTFDELHIELSGTIHMGNADSARTELIELAKSQPLKNVVLDLGKVEYFDSAGVAVLMDLRRTCIGLNNSLKLKNVPSNIESFLEVIEHAQVRSGSILTSPSEPNLFVQIGSGVQGIGKHTRDIITFIGASVAALWKDLSQPDKRKWDSLWKIVEKSGSDAVPIVTVLSFLMGGILAFQAAIQLRKFGANIFVADLVSLSICIEMGPLLTALIIAGRSGAAYAAHIGTMQVTEEIDALRVMGIDPIRYLVSPRIIGIAFVTPCLALFADLMGILGGCIVAVFSLDLTPTVYFNQIHKVLEIVDILKGLTKSFVFGIEIAIIGCLRGFQVRGGAESVGYATTSAVVTCIFMLTVTDAFFAVLFYYGPSL